MGLDKSKMIVTTLASQAVNELDNTLGNVILATVKTAKNNKNSLKVLGLGMAANATVHALDLDNMMSGVGLDKLVGIDAFVDNISDVAMLGAGAKLVHGLAKNVTNALENRKTNDELLTAFGIESENSIESIMD
ncbi:hypothetical protein [Fusobacterium necrophorum]|uniref:hypothetical protein n=1 Tax=Fusobacterium necrophorum TaxID=859 RepID=UPI00254F29CB|nr:hypothetical protein [Fusobacterium necrophorum]MDK4523122.1 hypothetical protein [Fusobacterium necrophorum]